eukprot:scaffold416_cov48-Phaeocystis_antarctica.AAC.1
MGHRRRLRHHPRRSTFTAATLATASTALHAHAAATPPPPYCRHAVAASASEFGSSLRSGTRRPPVGRRSFNPGPSPGNGGELETTVSLLTRNLARRHPSLTGPSRSTHPPATLVGYSKGRETVVLGEW